MAVQSSWILNIDGSPYDIGVCPNSCRLVYPAAATLTDLKDTVENFITNHGWTLYDASAGTNAKAYRALNYDAASYGYIVLDYNTSGKLLLKGYESWNSGSHSGTNLAYNSDSTSYCELADLTNGGTLYIACRSTHIVLQSVIGAGIGSSTGGAWCGVFEVARDNAEDTGSYPCNYWANGALFAAASSANVISPCRNRNGDTGSTAAGESTLLTDFGFGGPWVTTGSPGRGTTGYKLGNYLAALSTYFNIWSGKTLVSEIIVAAYTATMTEVRGRLRKIKVMPGGSLMDEVIIKVDSDGWLSPSGVSTTYLCFVDTTGYGSLIAPK